MIVVRMAEHGGPEVLEAVEVPAPSPGAGEVRVRASAIGVGATDIAIRRGAYPWIPPLPLTPGIELSGIVDAVGEGVDPSWLGRPVAASAREWEVRAGCYAQEVVAPVRSLFPLPPGFDVELGAALANAQVAYNLLGYAGPLEPGAVVVVMGAAGGVGSVAVQLAKLAGAEVIGVVGSPERAAFALGLGADHVIDRSVAAPTTEALSLTGGRGADLVVDHVAGPGASAWLPSLSIGGTLVLYGAVGGPPGDDLGPALLSSMGRSVGVRTFSMHSLDADPAARRGSMEKLIDLIASGAVRPAIDSVLPLSDAGEAHRRFEAGEVMGKLLLDPER